jgi:pyridoxine kinase
MRVLSVQSHVVSGYVGNKVATFALQTHGIEVDVLNTCQLSNHTGYTSGARGPKTTADEFAAILDGLAANGLLPRITHLLTGYAASEQALGGVERAVSMINAARPSSERRLVYVCDPVLGDDGVLYVPASLIPIYRERILPLAEVLTPNAFELSLLAGTTMPTCEAEVFAACEKLHDSAGLPTIIVTGVSFASSPQTVAMFVSQAGGERFALAADRLDSRFTGSGDLTSALILAWRELLPDNLRAACQRVMASVTAVLIRTLADAADADASSRQCPFPELALVRSAGDIVNPPTSLVRVRDVACRPLGRRA